MDNELFQNETDIIERNKTDWLANLVAFLMCQEIISLGLNSFVNRFISKGVIWDSLLVYVILLFFIVRAWRTQIIRVNVKAVILLLCVISFGLFGLLLYNDNSQLIPQEDYFLWIASFLLFILAQQPIKFDSVYNSFSRFYWIAILLGFVHFLTFEKTVSYGQTWMADMTAGYAILPATLFAIDYSFTRLKSIPWAILGLITILLLGSRGPLFIASLFLFIEIFRFSKTVWKKILFSALVITIILVVQTDTYILWLTWLNDILKANGLTVASLQKVLFYSDRSNGRNEVYTYAIQAINNRPILGNGIYFDRGFSAYSHNLFLEFFVDFGIVIGTITSLYIILCSIKMLIVNYKKNIRCFAVALILIFSVIGKLLFSSSYLHEPMFWLLIGLFCNGNNVMSIKGNFVKW